MPILTIETAIDHCRADPEDAAMVELYLGAAIDAAQEYLGRKVYADQTELDAAVAAGEAGELPMVATYSVKAAMLLICGHLFANREDVVVGAQSFAMPNGSRDLLRPHRKVQGL
ncbi:phage gp6-like head-tail connector protein [Delftia sp. SD018]|uniref:head-tail connector protein n=1 Tax=unclassified Delftia TaxID=2613839 RepID=UPI001A963C06|nr:MULTISPECIES: head-tail connector protein [unclassified Delftia]MBO0987552.1 phage gp6-like head-tail connector protein [Delftia sp. SD083]MBO1036157.1 phage gp6-like head-tail connector protein [Delftia sp. SD018]